MARPPPTGELSCNGETFEEVAMGWPKATDWEHYHACDFEVLDSLDRTSFEQQVRDLGRPVLLRNFAAQEDVNKTKTNMIITIRINCNIII